MAEAGIPAAELTTWIGVMSPAKLPPAIAKKIHEEFTAAVKDPKVIKQLADIGCDADPTTMENFDRLVQSENVRWGRRCPSKQHHRRLMQASRGGDPLSPAAAVFIRGTAHGAGSGFSCDAR
jgi:hypothetical protein